MPRFAKSTPKIALDAARERMRVARGALEFAESNPLTVSEPFAENMDLKRREVAIALDELRFAEAAAAADRKAQHAAELAQAVTDEPVLTDAHNKALENLISTTNAAEATIAQALALALSTAEERDAARDTLRKAGQHPEGDPRLSLASEFLSVYDRSSALSTAANLARWLQAAPQREGEDREFLRRQELAKKAQLRADALRGDLGPEARAAAEAERRAEIAYMQSKAGKPAVLVDVKGTAATVLDIARANLGVKA